jgi:hypothetical protein
VRLELIHGNSCRTADAKLEAPAGRTFMAQVGSAGRLCGSVMAQSRSLAAGKHHGNVTHYLSVIAADWAASFYVWLGGADPRRNPVARSGERLAPCAGWGSRSMVFVECSWLLAVCRERSG